MMKRIVSTIMLLALFATVFSQNKLDNLTDNPVKDNGHFLGKTGGVVLSDPYMASYAIAFDFWTSFNEPVYMFRFRWDLKPGAGDNTVKVNNVNKRFADYPEVWSKMKSRLTPLTDMDDNKLLTIPLYIQLRQGSKVLAHVTHNAKIDLPDAAGKWNVFALPSTDDWLKVFSPTPGGTSYIPFKTAGHEAYDYKLKDLYQAGNKEEYQKLMVEIFKEADNIKVAPGIVSNIRWNVSDYEYAVKEKVAEQKAATGKTKTSELDDLLNSTGYSEKDRAGSGTDRADAAYGKIKDYKDKTALAEAKQLYQQAAENPATAAHAKNRIAAIDKMLNYKEPNIAPNLDGIWKDDAYKTKMEIKGDNAVMFNSLIIKNIKYTGNLTWSCLYLGYIKNHPANIKMSDDGNSISVSYDWEGIIIKNYKRVK